MNPNKITECTDEKQLCELAAIHCMGWELVKDDTPSPFGLKDRPYWNNFNDPSADGCYDDEWQPTSPTEKGKAQCWDLAVKYDVSPYKLPGGNLWQVVAEIDKHLHIINKENPQIAVVKAAIITALNGEDYE